MEIERGRDDNPAFRGRSKVLWNEFQSPMEIGRGRDELQGVSAPWSRYVFSLRWRLEEVATNK